MSGWYGATLYGDDIRPDGLQEYEVVFVKTSDSSEVFGPIPAGILNWSLITEYRLAERETTYR